MSKTTWGSEPIVMYTTPWCGDCRRAKRLFAALRVPYTEVNVERDTQAANLVRQLNHGMQSVPTIIFPDGVRLTEPSHQALEAQLRRFISSNDSAIERRRETVDQHEGAGDECSG